ncbi:NAD(P)H-dependent oxidoreductase [Methyloradius palustris]|uniref:Glutathione-regulated potassium-efflux system ancillary protein KefG n=1 Tax=Methyloradius palustris TaxID=2778876 RepID=A0A8D5G123_9PROT|nr:NAD(P)H-dependent oxidoreductase [Methyloradius palustris]BCM25999.1 glutathione-regulated potassium-efflux system ancillary protein KefG [Methyloradius palustris]
MSNKVLVIFAHPSFETSRMNRALISVARECENVTVHDLYETYPNQFVDVACEQKLLNEHDVLVMQHPLQWYSCPPLMKSWLDNVLTTGWAYGPGGSALEGKYWVHAITSGGPEFMYQRGGYNNFSMAELLRPFEQTADFCSMHYLRPFLTHEVLRLEDEDIKQQAEQYRQWLLAITQGNLPPVVHTLHVPQADFKHAPPL